MAARDNLEKKSHSQPFLSILTLVLWLLTHTNWGKKKKKKE